MQQVNELMAGESDIAGLHTLAGESYITGTCTLEQVSRLVAGEAHSTDIHTRQPASPGPTSPTPTPCGK